MFIIEISNLHQVILSIRIILQKNEGGPIIMTDVTTNFKVTALHLNDELIADTYSFKNYDVNSHFTS